MSQNAQLVEPEQFTGIVEFNEFEKNLAEYKSRYEGVVYDLTDSDQEKRAKSDRLAIGKTIASLDRAHKGVKEPLKAQVDLLDGERKRIKDGLLEVQGSIKSQIAEHEAKIEAKERELLARVEAIKTLAIFDGFSPESALVESRIADIEGTVINESFEHYEAEATFAKVKSLEYLQELLTDVKKQEKDAADLAQLKKEQTEREQAEREARIAAEATAKAEQEAAEKIGRERQAKITAEANAKEAAERAVQAEVEAREKAEAAAKQVEIDRIAAEKAAKEAQAKAVAEGKEKVRLEAEAITAAAIARQNAREANKRHCAKINRAAAQVLSLKAEITIEQAKACIAAIAKNEVPAVSINY